MHNQHIRLKEIRKEKDLTQKQAAELIGASMQTWNMAEKNKTNLSRSNMEKVAKAFGVNLFWLQTGKGSKTGETIELTNIQNRKLVKLLSGSVLAGLVNSFEPDQIEVEDHIYIPGIKSKRDCYAIRVGGSSMEPHIQEGSTVIIEKVEERSEFKNEKNYVIISQGVPLLKKVTMLLQGEDKGKFELSSYNEERIQVISEEDIQAWYQVIYVINPM